MSNPPGYMASGASATGEGALQAAPYGESHENSKIIDQAPMKKLPSERSAGENLTSFPDG